LFSFSEFINILFSGSLKCLLLREEIKKPSVIRRNLSHLRYQPENDDGWITCPGVITVRRSECQMVNPVNFNILNGFYQSYIIGLKLLFIEAGFVNFVPAFPKIDKVLPNPANHFL
jgi:hypothetical protein